MPFRAFEGDDLDSTQECRNLCSIHKPGLFCSGIYLVDELLEILARGNLKVGMCSEIFYKGGTDFGFYILCFL